MKNRILSIILALCLIVPFGSFNVQAKDIYPKHHTCYEVKRYVLNAEKYFDVETTYDATPVTRSPYYIGKVSQASLNSGLEILNMYRYIAGLEPVTLDSEYNEYAQAACVLDEAAGVLSHSPGKPSDMSDDFYKFGYKGTGSCNLSSGGTAWGYNIPESVSSFVHDNNNLMPGVGHRSWALDPNMKKTGFGITAHFRAMYAFDSANSGLSWHSTDTYRNITWPAAETPIDYFFNAKYWSIRTGDKEKADNISIVITDISNNTKYTVSKSDISVDSGYGCADVVVFKSPINNLINNSTYNICISGITQGTYSYNVHFFYIHNTSDESSVPTKFSDVPFDEWYSASIDYCVNKGYFSGVGGGMFNPLGEMTREQFIQVLFNFSAEKKNDWLGGTDFSDVPNGEWYSPAIKWARENKITYGIGAGVFGLGVKITREQFANLLMNYSKHIGKNVTKRTELSKYSDLYEVSDWALDGMKWAVAERLIVGTTNTTLSPRTITNRASATMIFMNYDKYLAK